MAPLHFPLYWAALFFLLAGCEPAIDERPETPVEPTPAEPTPAEPTARSNEPEWSVAFFTSRRPVDHCPISLELRTVFLEVADRFEGDFRFEDWSSKDETFAPNLPSPFEGPQILLYHGDSPVDRHVGIQHPESRITAHYTGREFNKGAVLHLLARNGLIDTPPEELIFKGIARSGSDLRRSALGPYDYRGADLRGAVFAEAKLSGTRFDGADLRDTDFTGAEIFGVNFEGANIDGATFADTLVVQSTCPDGEPSSDDRCEW